MITTKRLSAVLMASMSQASRGTVWDAGVAQMTGKQRDIDFGSFRHITVEEEAVAEAGVVVEGLGME